MSIEFEFKKKLSPALATELKRFGAKTQRAIPLRGGICVLITGSDAMRSMNRAFRGKNKPTDVLSFPAGENSGRHVGDIAICADIAAANAKALGHTVAEEIKILALHGMLHLAGYDHETDAGQMAQKESLLRQQLGLPGSLIERAGANAKPLTPMQAGFGSVSTAKRTAIPGKPTTIKNGKVIVLTKGRGAARRKSAKAAKK